MPQKEVCSQVYYTLEYVCWTKSWLFCHQGVSSCGLLSVKVTVKSENRNRGIREGRVPRSILRKTKTFYYVLCDLRLQAVGGCGLVKEPVKGKNRLSSTHEPPSLSSVFLNGLCSHYTLYSVIVRWIMKLKPWFTYVIHLSQNVRGDGDSLTFNLEPWSIFYEVFNRKIHTTVFSLIRLCSDHLEKWGRRRAPLGSRQSKWSGLVWARLPSNNFSGTSSRQHETNEYTEE